MKQNINIQRYGYGKSDYPIARETILHFLIHSEGKDFEPAVYVLKDATRAWGTKTKMTLGAGIGCTFFNAAFLAAAPGAWIVLPVLAGGFAVWSVYQSVCELRGRNAELQFLEAHPGILPALDMAHKNGYSAESLLVAYDIVVGSYDPERGLSHSGRGEGMEAWKEPIEAFGSHVGISIQALESFKRVLGVSESASLPPNCPTETELSALSFTPESSAPTPQPKENNRRFDSEPLPAPKDTGLPAFDRLEILNQSKGLMVIGDMGAAKTCTVQHIAAACEEYGIIVFDPHGLTNWGDAYVLEDMGAIYEQMRILLKQLQKKDMSKLLVVCDEWLEILGDDLNKAGDYKGLANNFIRLFSTKPRKFNKLGAFILHSPNVEAAGVDSFLRENYLKIYLGRLAEKEFLGIKKVAYPCVVEGAQVEHPTHGHHFQFRPNGAKPRNIEPLKSAPIAIPLAYTKGDRVLVHEGGWAAGRFISSSDGHTVLDESTENAINDNDEEAGEVRFRVSDNLAEPLKSIYKYCLKKKGEGRNVLSARDISRACLPQLKDKTVKQIRGYLGLLSDAGYGDIDEDNKADSDVTFRVG
jgi:hypothetical protein